MDDRDIGRGPERALARALKEAASSRRTPEPPAALRDIAWGRTGAEAPAFGGGGRAARGIGSRRAGRAGSAADLAWAAALAACLACSAAFGRADTELARRLDDPAIARAIMDAVSPEGLSALGASLRGE